jgi:hypothetical protein
VAVTGKLTMNSQCEGTLNAASRCRPGRADHRADLLTPERAGDTDDGGLRHRWVVEQDVIDLAG